MRFPTGFLVLKAPASSIAIIMVAVLATGCATKRAYTGHPASDLSVVTVGTTRADVETALGQSEKTESREGALTAWYIYDRGYTGNLETISTGEKLAFAPIMAFGELVSLGLGGWMTACAAPCQKGSLLVQYDSDGRVVSAVESFLPDDHPLVAGCARSAVRGNIGVCQGVRAQVRPSSLPRTGP
jgi:hypothetical protein